MFHCTWCCPVITECYAAFALYTYKKTCDLPESFSFFFLSFLHKEEKKTFGGYISLIIQYSFLSISTESTSRYSTTPLTTLYSFTQKLISFTALIASLKAFLSKLLLLQEHLYQIFGNGISRILRPSQRVAKSHFLKFSWEAQWPHLQIKQFRFEPWLGTLCCILGKTLYSRSLSLHSSVQMGTGKTKLQRILEGKIFLVTSC